jgi:hypothetical protein
MHMGPGEAQETVRDGNTTHQSGMKLASISGLPQEAEVQTDHLPETTSYC